MPDPTRHIVALGGGGFSMATSPSDPDPIDDYILSLTGKRRPNVCFLPTASGDADTYIAKFVHAFPPRRATATVGRLFNRTLDPDIAARIASADVVYVGGGNTAYLLDVWARHGVDALLRKRWRRGRVVFAGISAGMNCWFSGCSTDSFGPLAPLDGGLGLLPEAACPHFDAETGRRPSLLRFVARGELPTTFAADDYAAFHFASASATARPTLHACVKSRLSAGCYRVEKVGTRATVTALPTRLLSRPARAR
jgi:peptidase E